MSLKMVKEYVKNGGVKCLYCKKESVEGGEVTVNNGRAHQSVWCTECGKGWSDTYDLVGVWTASSINSPESGLDNQGGLT